MCRHVCSAIALVVLALAGCSSSTTPVTDGGIDAARADGASSDAEVDASAPISCGGATCGATELCIQPCCGGAGPVCVPTPDGGPCDTGEACVAPDGTNGCRTTCTPPPPYCSPTLPTGCMIDASGEILCLCA